MSGHDMVAVAVSVVGHGADREVLWHAVCVCGWRSPGCGPDVDLESVVAAHALVDKVAS